MAQTVRKMKTDKFMYLPTMTEDEFAENIGKEDFFRRMTELCGFPGTEELIEHEPRT